jgi:hypothetical protein
MSSWWGTSEIGGQMDASLKGSEFLFLQKNGNNEGSLMNVGKPQPEFGHFVWQVHGKDGDLERGNALPGPKGGRHQPRGNGHLRLMGQWPKGNSTGGIDGDDEVGRS